VTSHDSELVVLYSLLLNKLARSRDETEAEFLKEFAGLDPLELGSTMISLCNKGFAIRSSGNAFSITNKGTSHLKSHVPNVIDRIQSGIKKRRTVFESFAKSSAPDSGDPSA